MLKEIDDSGTTECKTRFTNLLTWMAVAAEEELDAAAGG